MPDFYAALDIGTNSVLLTVAEGPDLRVVEQLSTVTRLGQDVDRTRSLHPDALLRTLSCLETYRAVLDRYQPRRARAVGTSALRDASGGDEFRSRARDILGFDVEVVSGLTEAKLAFSGALFGLDISGDAYVFDIGGGSTELIIGDAGSGDIHFSTSLNIGSVRLTERLALDDPPTPQQWTDLIETIETALDAGPTTFPEQLTVVGVAGTVTTLCAISQVLDTYDSSKVHGHTLELGTLTALSARLSTMTIEDRLTLPGLTPGRADVIAAGAALCAAIVRRSARDRLTVSDRGVRFGVLRELLACDT